MQVNDILGRVEKLIFVRWLVDIDSAVADGLKTEKSGTELKHRARRSNVIPCSVAEKPRRTRAAGSACGGDMLNDGMLNKARLALGYGS